MTKQEQIKALAELDGWRRNLDIQSGEPRWKLDDGWIDEESLIESCQNYLTSYDAIIPLIQKQSLGVRLTMFNAYKVSIMTTPKMFCEALLRATGKWKD